MMSRIIGVNSNCYHGYSIDEALEGIAAAGFHYVELTATKGWTEHVFPDQSFASLCHVQDKLKELDLVPFAMSGHTNLMDADRLPDFIMNMRLAHFFGCKYIVSSIGEAHLKDKAKTGNEVLVQNIKGLIPHLKENGLMLVLELHGEHATGTIMNEIVTAVNSNLVKINYDTANCVFYGNVDAADDIDTCMDNVAYLHIKDKAGARDAWIFLHLERATSILKRFSINWTRLITMLRSASKLSLPQKNRKIWMRSIPPLKNRRPI